MNVDLISLKAALTINYTNIPKQYELKSIHQRYLNNMNIKQKLNKKK